MVKKKKEDSSFKELNKKVSRNYEAITEVFFGKYLAHPFIKLALYPKMSPNQVTLVSLLSTIVGVIFIASGQYIYYIIGSLFFILGYVADCSDGKVARIRNMRSKLGGWFDSMSDKAKEMLMLLGVVIGVYSVTNNPKVLLLGLVGLFNLSFLNVLTVLADLQIMRGVPPLFIFKKVKSKLFKAKFFLGTASHLYFIVLFLVLNLPVVILWFYAIVFVFIWMYKIYQVVQVAKKEHKYFDRNERTNPDLFDDSGNNLE